MQRPDRSRLLETVDILEWRSDAAPRLTAISDAAHAAARQAAAPYGEDGRRAARCWVADPAVSAVLFWPERFSEPAEALHAALAGPSTQSRPLPDDMDVLVRDDQRAFAAQFGKIDDAFSLIHSVSPRAYLFTVAMTRSLTLAHSDERPIFWSSSPERFLYASRLWNLDRPEASAPVVADALVHEAVHSWLDLDCLLRRYETPSQPWLRGSLMSDGVSRLVSPWSGAPLSLSIFIHACFVWYALLNFWSDAFSAGIASESSTKLARRAWRGFVLRPDIRLREAAGSALSDEVEAAVARMTARVLGATEPELAA